MASVTLRDIRKQFDDGEPVIRGVDLEIRDGEFMVFVGPSGCGKSTLLRMIAGLETVSAGDLHIGPDRVNDLAPARRGVAMVFQSYALYPHMTVAENMGFSLEMSGTSRADIAREVARVAEVLQLSAVLDKRPAALSGGQRQRVAIGRAIVRKPKVFLFDEPLSNLDAGLRGQMRIELTRLHRELGTTMIYVTHDQTEAMTMGSRIAVFNRGRVEQVGEPMDLYRRPANRFVARFLGAPRMNLGEASVQPGESGIDLVCPGLGRYALSAAHRAIAPRVAGFGIRPEHLSIVSPGLGSVSLPVDAIERLGDVSLVHLARGPGVEPWCIKLPGDAPIPAVGEVLGLLPQAGGVVLFDESGVVLGHG